MSPAIEKYELPNGLEVILAPDHRLPTVTTNVWYHVGAADEGPAGGRSRTGFAHLFEHMMFQGSGHVPVGRFDELVEGAGGRLNASTHFDYTNYFIADLPADRLEMALWLESDRMGFLLDRLDAVNLANQQAVVRNERRQNCEQAPYALTSGELFRELFPPGHPYRGAVIGSHADIQAAELADVREFFRTYYVPNNATLVVAGNLDVDRTRTWIDKYFGPIPAGPARPQPSIPVPTLNGERRVVLTDEVELPKVTMAWLSPPIFSPGDVVADVTAAVLAGGESSRLWSTLVRGRKIAQSVSAHQSSASHPSIFFVTALAKPGHTAAELEEAIDAELAAQADHGPAADDLAAARAGLVADLVREFEGVADRADTLNAFNHFVGRPDYLEAYLAAYEGVGADAVREFVAGHLRPDARVVAYTVPGPRVLPPDPPAGPTPEPGPGPAPSPEPWRYDVPKRGRPPAVTLPRVHRFRLSNGLPVYLVESHAVPVIVASVVSRYGSAADPPGRAGLANLTAALLRQSTRGLAGGGLDADSVAREVAAVGGILSSTSGRDASWVTMQSLTPHADRCLDLLAALVRRPAFDADDIARVCDDLLVGLKQGATNPSWIAWDRMLPAVYGPEHPYGHTSYGTRAGLTGARRADLRRFHAAAFTPGTAGLMLAGDLTMRQARDLAERAFGGWRGTTAARAPRAPGRGTPAAERVVVVDMPGHTQTAIEIGQAGLRHSHPDCNALDLANLVLGGMGLSSRLMLNLRETHGYTYGVRSDLFAGRGPAPFAVSSAVEVQHTGDAVREILAEIARIRARKLTAKELRRAKESFAGTVPGLFATAPDGAATARSLFLYGLPRRYYERTAARLAPLTADDVRAAAARHLSPDDMRIVAVGDRALVEPQLRALGLGPIVHRRSDGTPVPDGA